MSTILTEVSTFTPTVITPNPGEPIKASDTIGTSYLIAGVDFNGGVIYVGKNPNVRVRHLGGMSMALAVTVLGDDITVQLATDGTGNVLSTANQVVIAFNLVVAATDRATATAQGTGASIAGIMTNFMKIGDDTFGSIRPALQSLANRTRYLFKKVIDMLFGTITFKSIRVDGTGDLAAVTSAGDIVASRDISSLRDTAAARDVVAVRDVVSGTGDISCLAGNIAALIGNVSAANDLLAGNRVQADFAELTTNIGSAILPNSTNALGKFYKDMMPVAFARIASDGSLIYGVNINTITHPATGKYRVVLNVSLIYFTNILITAKANMASISATNYDIVSTSPATIDIAVVEVALGGVSVDREFCVLIYGV